MSFTFVIFPSIIVDEALAEAHHLIDLVAQLSIKLDNPFVANADLEVDLRAAEFEQERFRPVHHHAPVSSPLAVRVHGEVVDPTPVAFVTSHDRGNDSSIVQGIVGVRGTVRGLFTAWRFSPALSIARLIWSGLPIRKARLHTNEEQLQIYLELPLDVLECIVPRAQKAAKTPKIDNCLLIAGSKWPDFQHGFEILS